MKGKESEEKFSELYYRRINRPKWEKEKMPLVGRCPNCGEYQVFVFFDENVASPGYRATCSFCGAAGPAYSVDKDDKGEYHSLLKAVEYWNRMKDHDDDMMVPIEYEGKDSSGHPFYSSIHTENE